jgi:hypothetical protein
MGGFNAAPRDFRGDVSVDGDLSVNGESQTNNSTTTLGLQSKTTFTGDAVKQVPLDITQTSQLSSVTTDTTNNKLIINDSGNYLTSAGVQLRPEDILGQRFFLNIRNNTSTAASRSDLIEHDFQRPPVAIKTLNLSQGDELTISVVASGAAATDSYEISSNRTFLQVTRI